MRSPFSAVRAQSLVDTLVGRLEAAIIQGHLTPGSKLSEQGLAKQFGVSRGPLREAIRRLEGRKLILRTPNIGATVVALEQKDLLEILQLREVLEGLAARLAAETMSTEQIADLRRLLDTHAHHDDLRAGTSYYQDPKNLDFHFRIATGCGNERLRNLVCGELYDLLRVYRYQSSAVLGRAQQSYDEHRAIVEALAARDGDRAEAHMRRHIRNSRTNLASELSKTPGGPLTVRSTARERTGYRERGRRGRKNTG